MMQNARPEAGRAADWYHPGEIVIVARVPRGAAGATAELNAEVHNALRGRAGQHLVDDHRTTRSFIFDGPGAQKSLAFFFHRLANRDAPRAVKDAVEALHSQLEALNGQNDV